MQCADSLIIHAHFQLNLMIFHSQNIGRGLHAANFGELQSM